MTRMPISFILLAALFFATTGAAQPTEATATQRIWEHHITAWNDRDVEAILSDYTQSSVVVVLNREHRGRKAIGDLFRQLFAIFDQAEIHKVDPATVVGKVVYITWRAKIRGMDFPFGTDTFVMEGGKIAYQTITSDPRLFTLAAPAPRGSPRSAR